MTVRTPDQTKFARELLAQYAVTKSYLRGLVHVEGNVEAKTFTWSIGSKPTGAQLRGANGKFTPADDVSTQVSATLKEWGVKRINTQYNIYTAPTNVRLNMQNLNIADINVTTDRLITDQLKTATQVPYTTTPSLMTFLKMQEMMTILDQNAVPDTERTFLVSPRAYRRLMQDPKFTSRDYVTDEPFMKPMEARMFEKTTIVKHPGLEGVGSASCICYLFHKRALGHGLVMGEMDVDSDWNREDKYFWSNATSMQESKMLLPEGVVAFYHDDVTAL